MKPKKTKAERIAELELKLREAEAGQAHVYYFADIALDKASIDHLRASGVIVTLTALGGREICAPILIRDGLSKETVAALRLDLARSYDVAIVLNPNEELK